MRPRSDDRGKSRPKNVFSFQTPTAVFASIAADRNESRHYGSTPLFPSRVLSALTATRAVPEVAKSLRRSRDSILFVIGSRTQDIPEHRRRATLPAAGLATQAIVDS